MRILSFSATRYRSLRAVGGWEPGPLNVLIGPNGSGKSNVLRAIDLLSASAQGRLSKAVQVAGGIEPILWDGQEDDFGLCVECSPTEEGRDATRESLTYDLRLARLGRGAILKSVLSNWQILVGCGRNSSVNRSNFLRGTA